MTELKDLLRSKIHRSLNKDQEASIRRHHRNLSEIVLNNPRMFHSKFEAGKLNIDPIELEFNCDIRYTKPIVSKIKSLSRKEQEILNLTEGK